MLKLNGSKIDGRSKMARRLRNEPGYSGSGEYKIARSSSGGWRLYKLVAGKWMDASLKDYLYSDLQ